VVVHLGQNFRRDFDLGFQFRSSEDFCMGFRFRSRESGDLSPFDEGTPWSRRRAQSVSERSRTVRVGEVFLLETRRGRGVGSRFRAGIWLRPAAAAGRVANCGQKRRSVRTGHGGAFLLPQSRLQTPVIGERSGTA
jgi:hypothetical protein